MRVNKGFTLVELIGVVVILGLISLIAIPTITSSLKKYKESLYKDSLDNIVQAAKNWGAENIGKLPNKAGTNVSMDYPEIDIETDYSTLYITLQQLSEEGFISSEIKNPKNGNLYCTKARLTITKTNSGYTYELEEDTLLLPEESCN